MTSDSAEPGAGGRPQRTRRSAPSDRPRDVTISDVARAAGVSTATVSRVMAGQKVVADELVERVRKAISELDYHPNRVARRLRAPGTQMWALVVSDLENPFFTSLARGVEEAARESGAVVFLGNSDENPQRESNYLEVALTERVGGVVLAPSSPETDIRTLRSAGVPVVVVDQWLHDRSVETVLSDNYGGGRLAAEEFLERGYRRIAAVLGPATDPFWNERLRGLTETLAESGAEVVSAQHRNNRSDGGEEAMRAIWSERESTGVDGVFISNNQMTIGALRALDDLGLATPEDVGIVGFDIGKAQLAYRVSITSVNQDPRRMGQLAGRYIHEAGRTDQPGRTTLLPLRVSRGGSLRELG